MDVSKFIKNMGINSIPNANYNPEEEGNNEPKGLILPDINAKSNQTLDMALRNQLYGWSVDPNKVNKYHRYGINWSPNIAGESLDRQLAEAQGAMEKLWHGVAQGVVGEIGLGTAIAFSDMFDAIGQAIGTSDHDYSNPLTRQLEAWKEQFNNEVAPIYTTPGVDILHGGLADAGWWASQMPSILTSVSLLLPGRAAAAGVGLVGKAANAARAARIASKAKKLENAAKLANEGRAMQAATTGTAKAFNRINSMKAVQNTAKALGRVEDYALSTRGWETIKHGANIAVTGAMQRTLENYQEARQVYDDVYVSALDTINKMDDDQYNAFLKRNANTLQNVDTNNKNEVAKAIAKKSADKTFLIDYLNTGFDVLQLYGLRNLPFKGFRNTANKFNRSVIKEHLKSIKYAGKTSDEVVDILSKRTTKEKVKDFFSGFGYTAKTLLPQTSEGVEEMINYVAQQEGMNVGHVLLGMADDSRFSRRLSQYATEAGLWESAFWGTLGGIAFEGLGSGYFRGRNAISKAINNRKNQVDTVTGEKVNMPGWTELFELPETKRSKQEIERRYNILQKYVDDVTTIRGGHNPYIQDEQGNNRAINDADKSVLEEKAFNDMVNSMTFNALDAGTFDLLKEYMSSEEIKQALVDKGITTKSNADQLQQRALQQMDNIAKQYDDNLIALDNIAMRINAEQDSPIPLEYLQIIARNNLTHQLNIENWQKQLDAYELDATQKEQFYRKNGKLGDTIDYKNTIRLAFLTEQLGLLEAEKRELENNTETSHTLSGQNTIAEYNSRIKAVKDMLYGLDSVNGVSNLLFAIEKSKGYEKVDGQILQTLRGKDYLDFRQIMHNLEHGDETVKSDMREALAAIDERFANITDADISQKKVFDDNLVRSYNGDNSFAKALKELHDDYVDIAALQYNIALERQNVALTEDEVAFEVNSLHNDMNDIRKQAILNATDTIMSLVDKYGSDTVRNALYERYTSNNIKEDYFGNNVDNVKDAKVFNDALDILHLKAAANKTLAADIEQLIAIHDAIKAGQSENSTTSETPIVEPNDQTTTNNTQPTPNTNTTQATGQIGQNQTTQPQQQTQVPTLSNNETGDDLDDFIDELFGNVPDTETKTETEQPKKQDTKRPQLKYRPLTNGAIEIISPNNNFPNNPILLPTQEQGEYHLVSNPTGGDIVEFLNDDEFYDKNGVSLTDDFVITTYPIVRYNQKDGITEVMLKGTISPNNEDAQVDVDKYVRPLYNQANEYRKGVQPNKANASTGEVMGGLDVDTNTPMPDDSFVLTGNEENNIPDSTGLVIPSNDTPMNEPDVDNLLLGTDDVPMPEEQEPPFLEGEPHIDQIRYSQLADYVLRRMNEDSVRNTVFNDDYWKEVRAQIIDRFKTTYDNDNDFNSDLERVIKWGNELTVLYQSTSPIADVIRKSMIAERHKGTELAKHFGEAVDKLIEQYKEDVSVDYDGTKYYFKLEDLLRYCTLDDTHAIPNVNADMVGNRLYNALVKYLQEHPEKYVLIDKSEIVDALRNAKMSIEERTATLNLPNIDYGINFLGRYWYLDENGEEDERNRLLSVFNSLQIGSKIKYKLERNKANNRDYIGFYYNDIQIGYLPTLSTDSNNGRFVQYNDGWRTDMDVNGNSDLKSLFLSWIRNDNNDKDIDNLNNLILNYAFDAAFDNLETNKQQALIDEFANNPVIKKAIDDGFTDKNVPYRRLLQGLSSLWAYTRRLSGFSIAATNEIRVKSVEEWFDKVKDSFNLVNGMTNNKEGEVIVGKLEEGKLIVLPPEKRKPISEAINEKVRPQIRLVIGDKNNNFIISGQNNNGSPIQNANIVGAGTIGNNNTGIIIPDRSGNYSFVHGYPIQLSSIKDRLPHPAKTLVNVIYDEIRRICQGEDTQQVCENLVEFLNKLTDRKNGNTPLLYSSYCKNIVTKVLKHDTTKINGFEITVFVPDKNGNRTPHTLHVVKQFINRNKNIYFTHSKNGKESLALFADNNYKNIKLGNDAIGEKIIEFLKKYYSFNIHPNFVESDNNNQFLLKGVAHRDKNGKFIITIGTRDFTYNSYNDFIIDNNLMDVTTEQSENGTNFNQNFEKGAEIHPDILIKLADDSSTPVEEINAVPTYSSTAQAVVNILNSTRKGKNMGKAIFEEIYKKAYKSLKINRKVFDLLPKSITFVDEYADDIAYGIVEDTDEAMTIGNTTVTPKRGEVIVTRRWLDMVNDTVAKQKEAVRKLIHEQLHIILHQNGNEKYVEQIREIYDEFVAKNTNEDLNAYKYEQSDTGKTDENGNKIIKNKEYWKDGKLNAAGLEEFLVESLTSAELANGLNEIEADAPTDKRKESLFDKIMKFLVDLFGWDIKDGSLYKKEFLLLADIIDNTQGNLSDNARNDNNTENQTQEPDVDNTKSNDTTVSFEADLSAADVEKRNTDEELVKNDDDAWASSKYTGRFVRKSSIEENNTFEKFADEEKIFANSLFRGVGQAPTIDDDGNLIIYTNWDKLGKMHSLSFSYSPSSALDYGERRSSSPYIIEIDEDYLNTILPLRDYDRTAIDNKESFRYDEEFGEVRLIFPNNLLIPKDKYNIYHAPVATLDFSDYHDMLKHIDDLYNIRKNDEIAEFNRDFESECYNRQSSTEDTINIESQIIEAIGKTLYDVVSLSIGSHHIGLDDFIYPHNKELIDKFIKEGYLFPVRYKFHNGELKGLPLSEQRLVRKTYMTYKLTYKAKREINDKINDFNKKVKYKQDNKYIPLSTFLNKLEKIEEDIAYDSYMRDYLDDITAIPVNSYTEFIESVPLSQRASIVNKIENGQYSMTCK